jgi:hypothetical protein
MESYDIPLRALPFIPAVAMIIFGEWQLPFSHSFSLIFILEEHYGML